MNVIQKIKNDYNIYLSVCTFSDLREIKKICGKYSDIKCLKLMQVNINVLYLKNCVLNL